MTHTYRVGSHNPRNIYLVGLDRDTDEHVGVLFTPQHARYVVAILNGALGPAADTAAPAPSDTATAEAAELVAAALDATERLRRIADAHLPRVDSGHTTDYCPECEMPWPCSTYHWADTPNLDPHGPWEPIEKDCS